MSDRTVFLVVAFALLVVGILSSILIYIAISRHKENPEELGFGRCYRCKVSWRWGIGHITNYKPDTGIFVLCETCWKELATGEKRLKYYKRHLLHSLKSLKQHRRMDLHRQTLRDWTLIERSVLDGK